MAKFKKDEFPDGTKIVDRELGIVRNPQISCGRACVESQWIGCIFIVGRFKAGETVAELAYDYNISEQEVLNAIAYIEKISKRYKNRS